MTLSAPRTLCVAGVLLVPPYMSADAAAFDVTDVTLSAPRAICVAGVALSGPL